MFSYFAFEFYHHRDASAMINGIAATTGDSPGYYNPAEAVAKGLGYNSTCRMPAFVPLYSPMSWILGEVNAKISMVFLQLIFSILSVIALGRWAQLLIQKPFVFQWTVVLYSLSSFVSIWDHYLMSDSFSTSFFIFSLYFLQKYFTDRKLWQLLLAGVLLAWCVFFRQIFLVVYPAFAIILFLMEERKWMRFIRTGVLFIAPLLIAILSWSAYTRARTGAAVILVSPLEECFNTYTKEYQALTGLLIDMGYGEPFWEDGSVPQWMLRSKKELPMPPIPERHFTSICSVDSLKALREDYRLFNSLSPQERDSIGQVILNKAERFSQAYKEENKINYYLLNRLRHVRVFLLPLKVDNLPGPAYAEMNALEKLVKLFYLGLFTLVTVIGSVAMVVMMRRNRIVAVWFAPAAFIFIALTLVLGYVEQRYMVPLYPMFLVCFAVALSSAFRKFQKGADTV